MNAPKSLRHMHQRQNNVMHFFPFRSSSTQIISATFPKHAGTLINAFEETLSKHIIQQQQQQQNLMIKNHTGPQCATFRPKASRLSRLVFHQYEIQC